MGPAPCPPTQGAEQATPSHVGTGPHRRSANLRVCGLLFCYNEEHILAETLDHYLRAGIDLVVVDNCSTDSSMDIVEDFRSGLADRWGRVCDVLRVETDGYEWGRILHAACDYMHQKLSDYDWIALIDADSFYHSPVRGMSLREYISAVDRFGYNVINGALYEFYPTDADDPTVASHTRRLRHYKPAVPWSPIQQQKIFRYHPTVDFHTMLGHECLRKRPRVWQTPGFIYKHYSWCSYEHGLKKIFAERKPRYVEQEESPDRHVHYMNLLPIHKDLVLKAGDLQCYGERRGLVSRRRFRASLLWGRISPSRCLSTMRYERKRILREALPPRPYSWRKRRAARLLHRRRPSSLKPSAKAFPHTYHFLMTNRCNARCIFCNQQGSEEPRQEITLETFKVMASHIPIQSARAFCFTGGGEPLLCRDLFAIIEYVNGAFPDVEVSIRTNGLLIGRHAEDLARLGVDRLEVSVHGTPATNDRLIQGRKSQAIFDGIASLNGLLRHRRKRLYKAFHPAVSSLNLGDLPALVRVAADLHVDRVSVAFCRYHAHSIQHGGGQLRPEDSLFFRKELYDETIRTTKRLARSLGVRFSYEPLFRDAVEKQPCCQPWEMMLVDWNGVVYPCCGGEERFGEKVTSGACHFGNLLSEQVYQCWNNTSYVELRRTIMPGSSEEFFPECRRCHQSLCFEGPNVRHGHIILPPEAPPDLD